MVRSAIGLRDSLIVEGKNLKSYWLKVEVRFTLKGKRLLYIGMR